MTYDTLPTEVRRPHPENLPMGSGLCVLVSTRLSTDRPVSAARVAKIGKARVGFAPTFIRWPDQDETGLSTSEKDIAIAQSFGAWA